MDCFWCGRGLYRPDDEIIIKKFDEALARRDPVMFESAMDDLMHALYHKVRSKYVPHEAAMDIVLGAMLKLWRVLKRKGQSGPESERK